MLAARPSADRTEVVAAQTRSATADSIREREDRREATAQLGVLATLVGHRLANSPTHQAQRQADMAVAHQPGVRPRRGPRRREAEVASYPSVLVGRLVVVRQRGETQSL
jgi:hypothetical protein